MTKSRVLFVTMLIAVAMTSMASADGGGTITALQAIVKTLQTTVASLQTSVAKLQNSANTQAQAGIAMATKLAALTTQVDALTKNPTTDTASPAEGSRSLSYQGVNYVLFNDTTKYVLTFDNADTHKTGTIDGAQATLNGARCIAGDGALMINYLSDIWVVCVDNTQTYQQALYGYPANDWIYLTNLTHRSWLLIGHTSQATTGLESMTRVTSSNGQQILKIRVSGETLYYPTNP